MKRLQLYIMVAAAVILSWGCDRDEDNGHRTATDTGDQVEVMIMMNVPSAATTRAMGTQDENCIDHLDVLVFLDNGTGQDETYLYTTHGTDVVASGNTSTVKVGLKRNTAGEAHRLVMIANLQKEVSTLKSSWTQTMTKRQVLESLTFEAYDLSETVEANRAWDTDTPRFLPVWGESDATHVISSSLLGSSIGTVKMLRSVATVDIVLNPDNNLDPQGFSNFKLKDIKVYNVPQQGYAAPDPDNLSGILADVPTWSAAFQRNAATVVAYHADDTAQEDLYGISKLIYIPEAPNTDGDPLNPANIPDDDQTCLVISGHYDGSPTETWYRIDFIDKLSASENLRYDILRNHRYTFYITAVDGPGYDTEEEAFRSSPMNLDTEVVVWDENNTMPDITFDRQYSLRVSADSLYFYDEGRAQAITVTPTSGLPNQMSEPEIECTTLAAADPDRDAYVVIKAGKLRKYIKIYQANEPELTIEVSPTTLTFYKSAPAPKTVTVTVYPADSRVYFTESPGANPITSWFSFPTNGLQYVTQYDFQPDPNNTNDILSSFITVYTQDASGVVVSRNVTIPQYATDLLLTPSNTGPYSYLAGNYFLTADANAPWQVTGSTPAGQASAFDTSTIYRATDSPVTYYFDLTANNSWAQRNITFQTTSPDPDFNPQDIVVTQDFRAPELSLNTTMLDLGSTDAGTSGAVTVTSNSKWQYSTSGDWSTVVGSATAAANTDIGSHTYSTTTGTGITFTPVPGSPATGTPAAGAYTASATFTTSDHAPATPAATGTLTITRTVPAYFEYLTFGSTDGDFTEKVVTVTANTNAAFQARTVGSETTTGTAVAASGWGEKTASVTAPINNSWSALTSNIYYVYEGIQSSSLGTLTQTEGYVISNAVANLVTNTGTSATFTVSLTGRWPTNIAVRAATGGSSATNRTEISGATGTVAAQTATNITTTNTSGTVTVGGNDTGAPRTVYIQYEHPVDGWTDITSFNQAIEPYISVGSNISALGIGTVTFSGNWTTSFNVTFSTTYTLLSHTVPANPNGGTYQLRYATGSYYGGVSRNLVITFNNPITKTNETIINKTISIQSTSWTVSGAFL